MKYFLNFFFGHVVTQPAVLVSLVKCDLFYHIYEFGNYYFFIFAEQFYLEICLFFPKRKNINLIIRAVIHKAISVLADTPHNRVFFQELVVLIFADTLLNFLADGFGYLFLHGFYVDITAVLSAFSEPVASVCAYKIMLFDMNLGAGESKKIFGIRVFY